MNSHVWYRFGKFGSSSAQNQKSLQKASFTGTGITVYDLKKEIIAKEHMTRNASDFDFALYNAESGEEYYNDSTVIPRASSVLARRLPPSKPGNGNAQNYVPELLSATHSKPSAPFSFGSSRHTPTHSKRSDFKSDALHEQKPASQFEAPASSMQDGDEAAQIAAMFEAEAEQWQQAKDKMANAEVVPRYYTGRPGFPKGGNSHHPRNFEHTKKAVPPGYICFRCGQKGHWIQECPTNENKEFDNKPRLKRTTGIPRSFLTTVEGPGDGGVMVTPEGGYVVAKPDSATWTQHKKLAKRNLTEEDIQNLQPSDPDLTCPICSKLLRNAVKTPCCQTAYCEHCISDHINDNDNICPECESVIKSESLLKPDTDRRNRVREYIDEMVKLTKDESKDGEDSSDQKSDSENPESKGDVKQEERQGTPIEKPTNDHKSYEKQGSENCTPLHTNVSATTSEGIPLSPRSPEIDDYVQTSHDKPDSKSNTNTNARRVPMLAGNNAQMTQMNAGGGMPGNMMMGMNGPMNNSNMMAAAMMMMNSGNNMGMMMQNDGGGPGSHMGGGMNHMMGSGGMMSGVGGNGGPMGGNSRPNPMMIQQMLQQTRQQFQSNPNLPPPMRMQLQMQIQQLQNMLMQIQMAENGGGPSPNNMSNGPLPGMMNNPNMRPAMMNNGFNPGMNMPQNGQMGMFNRMEPQMMGMPNGMPGQMGFGNNFNAMQQHQGLNAFGMKPMANPSFRLQNNSNNINPQQHNRSNGISGQKRIRAFDSPEGQSERPKMQRQS